MDFMEVHSMLMENFVWDYRVVSLWAKHFRTGETIPRELFENMKNSHFEFRALDMEEMISMAHYDIILHCNTHPLNSTELLCKMQEKYTRFFICDGNGIINSSTSFPPVPNSHWQTKFAHLVSGYQATYYSYLTCRILSDRIWEQCNEIFERNISRNFSGFARDPLNSNVGTSYVNTMLRYGGSRKPLKMLSDMLGYELDIMQLVS
jgi:intermediate peptidase